MKKSFIMGSLILAFLASCNNEQLAIVSYEAGKSPDVVNFEKAIKSLGNSENKETPEEKMQRGNSSELNNRRKDLLIPSALGLIKSTGATESKIRKETQGDRDKILVWAVKIYNQKINNINNNLKNQ
ncbi:hypothetical protein [Chryseobacterium sp. ISL-6]|uniref:hypothetical protein n=1 Tax=Chryseobacterium sp. ISL-6 TaxID=2819143 RepID=UPI001BEC9A35|nr:hypothetical protein [Chryseobacterium sp. ISL-6]MBT2623612.1 hypothetical protein [Chryseobacterium sp. ISL-6]